MNNDSSATEASRRGRGRPRTHPLPDPNAPKRGRGRPRKLEQQEIALEQDIEIHQQHPTTNALFTHNDFSTVPNVAESATPETENISEDFWGVAPTPRSLRPNFYRRQWPKLPAKSVAVVAVLVILAVGFVIARKNTSRSAVHSSLTKADLLQKVGRLTDLPSGEQPFIYTVSDQSKTSQPFLKNALTGDQVLLYKQAGKAVVYRLSSDKLIAVGPVGGTVLTQPAPNAVRSTLNVALYNGTPVAGVTSSYELKLESRPEYSVVMREKAARSDYAKTKVVDLSAQHAPQAAAAAALLGAEVSSLPDGETAPVADLLIIVGSDYKN